VKLQILDSFSSRVTRHPRAVLISVMLVGALFGLMIPRITADFSPSELFGKFEDHEALTQAFQDDFGNTDNVLAILIAVDESVSAGVYDARVLEAIHTITRVLGDASYIGRTESITRIPIRVSGAPADVSEEARALGALWRLGATSAGQISGSIAMLAGRPQPTLSVEPPSVLLRLASGDGIGLIPLVTDGRVSDEAAAALRDTVAGSPMVIGQLVSEDGTSALVVLQLADGLTRNDQITDVVGQVLAALEEIALPEALSVRVGGLPYIRTMLIDRMRQDQSVLLPLSIVVCILILFIAFRWLPAMVLPTIAIVVSAVILVGGMALVGEPFNILNNIIPLVIIVIGISNAIHLINRYLEEYAETQDAEVAARRMVRTMMVACFLTSFTTAVGFGSLVVSQTQSLRSFGLTAAAGVMITYVVTIAFVPAALARFGASPPRRPGNTHGGRFEDVVEVCTRAVLRHPWPILAGSVVVLAASVWIGRTVVVDNAVLDQFSPTDEISVTTRLLEDQFTGVRPLEVYLSAHREGRFDEADVLNALNEIGAWAARDDAVIAARGYGDLLGEVRVAMTNDPRTRGRAFDSSDQVRRFAALVAAAGRDPSAHYVTQDRTRMRYTIYMRDVGAQRTIAFAEELDAELARRLDALSGVTYRLTGDAYVSSLGLDLVITDLLGSLALAFVIIFGVITVLLRDLRLGLVSIAPSVLPLLLTLVYMAATGILLNAATVIIFSVSIGLAVDGTIHVLARYREERARSSDVDEALIRSARGTGKAIALMTISLMLGFGVMLLSSFVPIRRFGTLIGVTVFGCLIATIVLLPALIKVTAPRTPPHDGRASSTDASAADPRP